MKIHPLAELFPPLERDELQFLADDIKANGLNQLILLYEGQILDGRNRFAACEMAGVAPRFHAAVAVTKAPPLQKGWSERSLWDCPICGASNLDNLVARWCVGCKNVGRIDPPEDPLKLVLSRNLYRRHLTTSQRAMVADKLATMKQGARTDLTEISVMSQPQAAAALNISTDAVQHARQVREHGAPELVKAVERGDIAVSAAAKVAKAVPKTEQAQVVSGGKAEIRKVVKAAEAAPKPKLLDPPAPSSKTRTKRAQVDDLLPHMHRIAGTNLADITEMEWLLSLPSEEREQLIAEAEAGKSVTATGRAEKRVSLSSPEMKRLLTARSEHSARMAADMIKEALGDRLERFQCLLNGLYGHNELGELQYALYGWSEDEQYADGEAEHADAA